MPPMPTLNISENAHLKLKRLVLDSQEVDKKISLQDTGDKAVLLGIEAMRSRLEAQPKKGKSRK